MSLCSQCSDSCPEPVETINIDQSTTEIAGTGFDLTSVQVSPTQWRVTLQCIVVDNFPIKFWFVDSPQKDAAKSMIPPDTPGVVEWEQVTDATGELIVNVIHAGAKTVYLCATLGAGIEITGALTFV